jgi:hypothetical protein
MLGNKQEEGEVVNGEWRGDSENSPENWWKLKKIYERLGLKSNGFAFLESTMYLPTSYNFI